jgi:hypothetical protein
MKALNPRACRSLLSRLAHLALAPEDLHTSHVVPSTRYRTQGSLPVAVVVLVPSLIDR